MSKIKKIVIIVIIIIILIISFLLLINRSSSYNYIYDNTFIEEDTSIGRNLYIVSKTGNINTKSKNYKKVIDEKISDVLKQEIDFENMIIIYNPYDNNKDSIRLYFITNYNVKVNYKLTNPSKSSDYFTTIGKKYTTQHEYELSGIVLGEKNKLEVELRDKENKLIGTNVVELDFSNVK